MTQFEISIRDVDVGYACDRDQTLLAGMERLGKKGIPVGCRGGGCGVCKVRIEAGDYRTRKMSRAQISEREERQGYVLACRCLPLTDITLTVVGKMKSAVHGRTAEE